jgi:two-component system nitrate/nitrite response regulator NarL
VAAGTDSTGGERRLLLASARPAVRSFFLELRELDGAPVHVVFAPVSADALDDEAVARATAAVVDAAPEAVGAVELCRTLAARRPELPLAVLLCCPHAVAPGHLRDLVATGVRGWLDLDATPAEAARVLAIVVRGGAAVRVQLGRGYVEATRALLFDRRAGHEVRSRLLELVAQGLPDRVIGQRLHLSPHTVKHHVEQLRDEVGVRNRIELAAWAGRNGFYIPVSK